jgi:hypothetical protein
VIAINVTNGASAPLFMRDPKTKTKKRKKIYETLRIETEVKRQLALACPKAYTYSEFLRRLLSMHNKGKN